MTILNETNSSTALNNMSKWRRWCWPVQSSELGKFLPLFFMKLGVSFNYTVLNATKDTVVVTSSGGGAEVIPALKGGVVIVIAFLVMLLYSKLSNNLSRTKLFYTIVTPFLVFFLIYGTLLFPYRDFISPHDSADQLLNFIGEGHKHWVAVYRYWMNTIFFVMAELWGGMMIGVLFWGFANQITSVKDAARFYALYTAGGHIGTILAGTLVYTFSQIMQQQNFEATVYSLMLIVVLVGVGIIGLYWWTNKYVVSKPGFTLNMPKLEKDLNRKTKLSLKDSIMYIMRSPYLGLIALMVIGYGLSVNMVEVTWKAILQLQYPDSNDYQAFMGILQLCIGIVSLMVAVFFGGNMMRKYGWYASAQLTPIVLGITSMLFFALYFMFPDFTQEQPVLFALSPLMLLVVCGAVHNVACKAMKYCLFDPTKEMAYIPLDREAKVKGKAAVDLVGARFGKSGASWLQLGLIDLVGAGSILEVVPLLVPCVLLVVACWLFAVHNLNKRFMRIQTEKAPKAMPADLIPA
jgi:AAA family ATP:ADP antiporter